MDRRDFIRQALVTALASGPLQTLSRSGAVWASDDPVCGLPGGYCYGLYDNFDGEGGMNPDTGEHLAREGEFAPALWKFYLSNSEVVHMDDLNGAGKAGPVPVDDEGIPVSIYQDPALAMIAKYLLGERPGDDRLYDITPLLDGVTLSMLHGESDPRSMVEQLLAQHAIFSPEGEVAAQYLRTGDLWLLHGISSWTLEAIQKIRSLSGYSPGQGPSRVRFLERDLGGQEREAGSIGLVSKDEVERHVGQSKRSTEDRVLPMPRRVTGRRTPLDLRAKPSGYIARMDNATNVDMRLELVHPSKIQFGEYYSWCADVFAAATSESKNFKVNLDYHTSIPAQGGNSWYCQIGFREKPGASGPISECLFGYWGNVNTGEGNFTWLGVAALDKWYRLEMRFVLPEMDPTLSDAEFRIEYWVNGLLRGSSIPTDSALLLDPSSLAFGPIRSFNTVSFDDLQVEGLLDNVRAAYPLSQR